MGIFANSGPLLISTCITVLICGAVIYFCSTRLNAIEQTVQTQNKVLADFIFNVQTDLRNGGGATRFKSAEESVTSTNSLSTPEARLAVAELLERNNGKVAASDDEDDEEDSSDEDESSNSESDEEELVPQVLTQYVPQSVPQSELLEYEVLCTDNNNIKIIDLDQHKVVVSDSDDDADDDASSSSDDDIDEKIIITKLPSPSLTVTAPPVPVTVPVHVTAPVTVPVIAPVTAPVQLDSMKVDDLRKLVVDQKLSTKEGARKLKKNELLALFL